MSLRKPAEGALTTRQKLTLFHGSGLNAEKALSTKDEEIGFDMLVKNGVKALNICAAGIRPLCLKQHGVTTAAQMRRLGFDALHLVDPVTCQEANAAYGAADVVEAFLQTPADAVALSGSEAISTLNLSTQQLLEACAGAPTEALEVLRQATEPSPLKGVSTTTLLDTGLRAPQLKQLGYSFAATREMHVVSAHDVEKLGFRL
jgi:hypothetical protein